MLKTRQTYSPTSAYATSPALRLSLEFAFGVVVMKEYLPLS